MKDVKKEVNEAIDQAIRVELDAFIAAKDCDEANEALDKIRKLESMKFPKKEINIDLKADTVAVCLTNLIGIGLIIGYEHYHPIVSKAMSMVIRGRV